MVTYVHLEGDPVTIEESGAVVNGNAVTETSSGSAAMSGQPMQGGRSGEFDSGDNFLSINGGFLVAVGSSRMAQAPSTTTTKYSILHNFQSAQPASGTLKPGSFAFQVVFAPNGLIKLSSPSWVKVSVRGTPFSSQPMRA